MVQRLTDFDTRLAKMYDDHTYLSRAIQPGSSLLLHQAEVSQIATSLQLTTKVDTMRLSYTTSTQPIELRNETVNYQMDFLYEMLMMPTGDIPLTHELRHSTETFMARFTDLTANIEYLERMWYRHEAGNQRPHQLLYSQEGDYLGITQSLDVTDQTLQRLYSDIPPVEPFRPFNQPYPFRIPYEVTDRNPFGGKVFPDGSYFFQGERFASWHRSPLRLLP